MAISAGVSMSVRAGAGACACGFGLVTGLGAGRDTGFGASVVRLRAIFSLRNCALSPFTSFFSFLIFLSFFDIA